MANIYANNRLGEEGGWVEGIIGLANTIFKQGTDVYMTDTQTAAQLEIAREKTKQAALMAQADKDSGKKDNTQLYLIAGGVAVTGLLLFVMLKK